MGTKGRILFLGLAVVAFCARAAITTGPSSGGSGGVSDSTATNISRLYATSAVPAVTISWKGITNGFATIPNDGKMFGPDTPNTQTSGIQEALDSFSKGFEMGPSAAFVSVDAAPGYYYYTNTIVYSNRWTTDFQLRSGGLVGSRFVFAGTNKGVDCFRIMGATNPPAIPMHVTIRDIGFSALYDTTNVLLRITNVSHVQIENCNFTSWNATTNNSWGSGVSIFGAGASTANMGLVGLVLGNHLEHKAVVDDCYFAWLATAVDSYVDHLYMKAPKFAFIGAGTNMWPSSSVYSLGNCIVHNGGSIDTHYYGPHFWGSKAGIASLGLTPQVLENPVWEGGVTPYLSAKDTNCEFIITGQARDTDGEVILADLNAVTYKIYDTPTYSVSNSPLRVRYAVLDNPAFIVGDLNMVNGKINDGSLAVGRDSVVMMAPRTSASTNVLFMSGTKSLGLDGFWFISGTRSYTNANIPGTACFVDTPNGTLTFTNAAHHDTDLDYLLSATRESVSNVVADSWSDVEDNVPGVRGYFSRPTNSMALVRGALNSLQLFGAYRNPSGDFGDDTTVYFENSRNSTLTLPDARAVPGRIIFVKNWFDKGNPTLPVTNTVINTSLSQKIDNSSTYTITNWWDSVAFYAFDGNWSVISKGLLATNTSSGGAGNTLKFDDDQNAVEVIGDEEVGQVNVYAWDGAAYTTVGIFNKDNSIIRNVDHSSSVTTWADGALSLTAGTTLTAIVDSGAVFSADGASLTTTVSDKAANTFITLDGNSGVVSVSAGNGFAPPPMNADPATPGNGVVWFRDDLDAWRGYDGTDFGTFTFTADP